MRGRRTSPLSTCPTCGMHYKDWGYHVKSHPDRPRPPDGCCFDCGRLIDLYNNAEAKTLLDANVGRIVVCDQCWKKRLWPPTGIIAIYAGGR